MNNHPPFFVVLSLALLAGYGCGQSSVRLVNTAAAYVSLADPAIRLVYEAEQTACLSSPAPESCVAAVRAKWAPIKDASLAVRAAWCEVMPDKCTP